MTDPRTLPRAGLLVSLMLVAAVGCASEGAGDTDDGTEPGSELTVSAAASLTDAFEELTTSFEMAHPEVEVTLTFDSSSRLATQALEGAPVDVLASADEDSVERLMDAGRVGSAPTTFATNELVVVTQPGNPAGVATLGDLAEVDGTVSLCAEQAPCGRYAAEVLAADGVTIPGTRITRAQNASGTLAAVSQGDAVAGIVYASDVRRAAGAVEVVALPEPIDVVARYPIAVLDGAPEPAAEAFVAWVTGREGQATLERHGFGAPP